MAAEVVDCAAAAAAVAAALDMLAIADTCGVMVGTPVVAVEENLLAWMRA